MTKKIVFIIGTLSTGGAERVVSNISLNLSDNIEREIILYGSDTKIDYDYKGQIVYLDKALSNNILSKVINFIKRCFKLRKIKKMNRNAKIISLTEYPNLLNIVSGYNHNTIVSVRNYMSSKHNKGIKSLFWNITVKYLYRYAKDIVVVSNEMKKDLVESYKLSKDKIEVIYNSYPLKQIETLCNGLIAKKYDSIFERPTIITAGRLHEQKGHIHLLYSFSKIKEAIPDAQLVILGEGGLKEKLEYLAKTLDIKDSVHFLGFQKNPFKYIAKSSAFVMTSYYEGFPNALAEAMACGVPVISTDCLSGPREIISPNSNRETKQYGALEHGFLVPEITEKNHRQIETEIADIVINVLLDKNLNQVYSEKSKQRVKDFDIENVIQKWEKLLN